MSSVEGQKAYAQNLWSLANLITGCAACPDRLLSPTL